MNPRRLLILSHRYLGIAISLMCVVWFASGIVMMYAGGMPRLTQQARLERLPALDLARVQLTPAQAASRLGPEFTSSRTVLQSVMDRPAYRFDDQTVFADSGEVLNGIDVATAQRIASRFAQVSANRVHFESTIDSPDQWTVQHREMPLHKFRIDDEQATELYVSPRTAEVTLVTTGRARALAWMGTIPHWLYFVALRNHQPLWY